VAKHSSAARKTDADSPPVGATRRRAAQAAALDRLIHERIRLGIVSALAVSDSLTFNDLKGLLKTSDGNLSVHARKLEEAQYVACTSRSPAACRRRRIASRRPGGGLWSGISTTWRR